ncbi:MAG: HNH endonuclease [Acidimicrobiia bacterium]|nr:HNH endonuclease [Acidimicrobiia bacterium]
MRGSDTSVCVGVVGSGSGDDGAGGADASGASRRRSHPRFGGSREHVRVGRALPALPVIRAAFARGELSYSKARALTRVASPDTEGQLVELGLQATASQLDRILRAHRRVTRDQAGEGHSRREVLMYSEAEDSVVIRARLSRDDAALVMAALDSLVADDAPDGDGSAEPRCRSRADALVLLAETALADGARPATGGERTQVVVHVDAHTLRHDDTDPGRPDGSVDLSRRCHLENGSALSADTARRLACDASVVEVATDERGTPLSVGRRTRSVPTHIRRALQNRDGGCRFPGCTQRRYVDAHHVRHWSNGGPTSLDNLVLLCRRHHRAIHEGGFVLRLVDAHRVEVDRPDGTPIPHDGSAEPSGSPPDPDRIIEANRTHGVTPGARTATARDGGRLDLDLTAICYFPILDRARRDPDPPPVR